MAAKSALVMILGGLWLIWRGLMPPAGEIALAGDGAIHVMFIAFPGVILLLLGVLLARLDPQRPPADQEKADGS